jgi:hypothetical protein
MNRRAFLTGTAAGAAAIAGLTGTSFGQGQAPAGRGRQGQAGGRGGGRGRGRGGPANVPAERLARLSMMTLNHGSIIKLPWQDPAPQRTIDIMDLPQHYVDTYGIRNVEFQHGHLAQSQDNPDPAFFRELKTKFDAAGSKAVQINIEIGQIPTALATPESRATWLTRGKKWADVAPILGITRLMINQTGLNDENKAAVAALWKELQDYATPKGIMISAETRGSGTPGGGRGGAAAPPAPAQTEEQRMRLVWVLLAEAAEASGGYTNLDWGGATRFATQQQLHDSIKGLLPRSAGSMHIKSSPTWDMGLAVRYSESLGYKGLYTIEVNPDPAIRIVYNTILAALA